jgi:queuine tRNA-ribosyltransferase
MDHASTKNPAPTKNSLLIFNQLHRSNTGYARTGVLNLSGIAIETPVFMPVGTRASIKSLSPWDIDEIGYNLILANTYHLYLRPGMDVIEKIGGVKRFMSYNKALLTDSGGFQIFRLSGQFKLDDDGVGFQSHIDGSRHRFEPEGVVDHQIKFGSDIMMVLDDCPPYASDTSRIELSLKRTHSWAKRSIKHWNSLEKKNHLFAICQGSVSIKHRIESIKTLQDLSFSGIAQGGLSVGEPREEMIHTLEEISPFLDPNRPRYLMGVGTIPDILDAVRCGIDMMDCVLPSRNARNAQLFTSFGKLNMRNEIHKYSDEPIDPKCSCKVCKTISRSYLRHLHNTGELSAFSLSTYHNLHFMKEFMKNLRESIQKDNYEAFYREWKNLFSTLK